MYKVGIHPPGSAFPPNGFPVIQLNYRNDDGGTGYGKDSRLFFDPPADGEYQVRIGDSRGQGGRNYAYRLTVRPPRPDLLARLRDRARKLVWLNPEPRERWNTGDSVIGLYAPVCDVVLGCGNLRELLVALKQVF